VQGERRVELVRALLSRSLHSPLQLVCDGKGKTIFGTFQVFFLISSWVVATVKQYCDKLGA
jgi:hypothetical protein